MTTSASLGNLSSGSLGFAAGELGTPGIGSPRASSSFFSVALSPCRRAISASNDERSSGTAKPRVSRRLKKIARGIGPN
jgi:hypothetical protein